MRLMNQRTCPNGCAFPSFNRLPDLPFLPYAIIRALDILGCPRNAQAAVVCPREKLWSSSRDLGIEVVESSQRGWQTSLLFSSTVEYIHTLNEVPPHPTTSLLFPVVTLCSYGDLSYLYPSFPGLGQEHPRGFHCFRSVPRFSRWTTPPSFSQPSSVFVARAVCV